MRFQDRSGRDSDRREREWKGNGERALEWEKCMKEIEIKMKIMEKST